MTGSCAKRESPVKNNYKNEYAATHPAELIHRRAVSSTRQLAHVLQNMRIALALILSTASFTAPCALANHQPITSASADSAPAEAAESPEDAECNFAESEDNKILHKGEVSVNVTFHPKPETEGQDNSKERKASSFFHTASRHKTPASDSVKIAPEGGAVQSELTLHSSSSSDDNEAATVVEGKAKAIGADVGDEAAKLEGAITVTAPKNLFDQALLGVLQSAKQTPDAKKYAEAVASFSKHRANVRARASDAVNSVFMFKGITTSTEAGNTILDEKLQLTSVGSAKYAKQKFEDDAELKTVTNLLQMASALGNPSKPGAQGQIEEAKEELTKIAGAQSAERAYSTMKAFAEQASVNSQPPNWTVSKTQNKIQAGIQSAALHDPIVDDIKADIHHFNKHSRSALIAHSVLRVTLSVTSLAPNVVGPASQALLFGYVVLTGGSEQSKILKELYMEKRLTDRASLLREEMHLAFHNYELGTLTKNPALTECSKMLVARMTDSKTAENLLTTDDVPQIAKPVDPLAADEKKRYRRHPATRVRTPNLK